MLKKSQKSGTDEILLGALDNLRGCKETQQDWLDSWKKTLNTE